MPSLEYEGRVCDLWWGGDSVSIYHWHRPYQEAHAPGGMIPPKPGAPVDPGVAIVATRTEMSAADKAAVKEFRAHYPATYLPQAENQTGMSCPPELGSEDFKFLRERIRALGVELQINMSIGLGEADRFLAKTAIGMGTLFLKPEFQTSDAASKLRDILWEQDHERREAVAVPRTAPFMMSPIAEELSEIEVGDGHLLMLIGKPNGVFLFLLIYGTIPACILVAPPEFATAAARQGIVYVISHEQRQAVGPLQYETFAAWRHGILRYPPLDDVTGRCPLPRDGLPAIELPGPEEPRFEPA